MKKEFFCGGKIDDIIEEIANREEIKKQFDYYEKNGIKDLAPIIKNWYESYNKNKGRTNNITLVD